MTRFFRHCGYYFGYYSYMLLNMLYYMFFLPFMKPGRANFILAKKAKVFTDFMRWIIHLGFTVKGKENILKNYAKTILPMLYKWNNKA